MRLAMPGHLELLKTLSVRTGTFTLASGKTSDFYVDVRQTSLHAQGCIAIAEAILDRLDPSVVAVGGMTLGADPLACSTATLAGLRGRPLHAFIVRKQPKGHGVEQLVVGRGNLPEGASVAVLEDTTTTGGSLLRAIRAVEDSGLNVVQVITVVDREEGAVDALALAGYTLDAITNRTELLG